MKFKEYEYCKTAKKTANTNNLQISNVDSKLLFDFTLLDNMELKEFEKSCIIESALKHVRNSNKTDFYGVSYNQFEACDGIARYHVTKVFSDNGCKYLYSIFTLAIIKHNTMDRTSVYDKMYNVTTQELNNGYNELLNDIEL